MIATYNQWMARIEANYANPVERQRAIGLTLLVLSSFILWLLSSLVYVMPNILTSAEIPMEEVVVFAASPVLLYAIHWLVQGGNLRLATYAFLLLVLFSSFATLFEDLNTVNAIFLALALIAGGMLLGGRELLVYLLIFNGISFVIAYNYSQQIDRQVILTPETLFAFVLILLASIVSCIFMWVFNGGIHRAIHTMTATIERFDDVAEYTGTLSRARDENTAMLALSDIVVDRLLYTHLQIHLFDDQNRLLTYIRTGMGTRHSVTPNEVHRVEGSALKLVIDSQSPIVVYPDDSNARRLHLLPSCSSGMVLPLVHERRVIGLVDVQSNRLTPPFSTSQQMLLRLIAREFGNHLARIREVNTLRQVLAEREAVASRLEGQITRLQQQIEQSAGSDWRAYIEGRGTGAFGFNIRREDMRLTPANDLPETLLPALQSGEIITQQTAREQIIIVPIRFRQEVLGAMSFVVPKDHMITDQQKEMAQTVAQRLALALENARLVEQSRAQAEREHTASEVAGMLIGQQDIDLLLDVAAEGFNNALGAIYTQIYLEPEAQQAQLARQEEHE
jgi:GAF domain-containing protein